MRSIAIMNQKGGVGKTTTAVNISAALAATGRKVCLIDLDPQAHASLHLGVLEVQQPDFDSVYDVLVEQKELRDVRRCVADNLWVVPAHRDLGGAELHLAGVPGREMILRDKLASDDLSFDYVLIDCPPSLGVLTLNALTAVDEVLIPLLPQYLPLQGLGEQLRTIDLVAKRLNSRLILSGVVFCIYDNTLLASDVVQEVDAFFQLEHIKPCWSQVRIFQTKIRRNVRLAEASSRGEPIFNYDPYSNGAEDYRRLTEEIVEHMVGR